MNLTNDYDIMYKVAWVTYDNLKKSNYDFGDIDDSDKLSILEFYLLPIFITCEEYEICNDLNNQINLIKTT